MPVPWDRIAVAVTLALVGTALVVARRYRNKDKTAGLAIAGWTLFFVILILTGGV